MSFPRILAVVTVLLFGAIAIAGWFKKQENAAAQEDGTPASVEIALPTPAGTEPTNSIYAEPASLGLTVKDAEGLPDADRIAMLFNRGEPRLPIVETIAYQSRVPWMNGRPAWLSDYASHYRTSRHFIARSLNGRPDYVSQDIRNGDSINVFRGDKDISFHLLVDVSRCKMWLYYLEGGENGERVLLKRYNVGLGRPAPEKASGLLTPLGRYSLGDRIATYGPKVTGYYQGERVEMIRIFGTRWIPFEKELGGCTEPARGFGIHGAPYAENASGKLEQETNSIGAYDGDGCIRLATDDVEEIFSIIITHPAVIELVSDFNDAQLPGKEREV